MRLIIFFVVSLVAMTLLAIITIFFLDKFLFYLHGYPAILTSSPTVESNAAYETIYKDKIVIIWGGLILGVGLILFARKVSAQNPNPIFTILFVIAWLIASFFAFCCVTWMKMPKGPIVM